MIKQRQAGDNTPDKVVVEADPAALDLSRRLLEARTNSKQWGEMADYFKDELIEHVRDLAGEQADADKVIVASGSVAVCSVVEVTRHVFDKDAFKRAHPEIDLDDYQKVSTSVTVRVERV